MSEVDAGRAKPADVAARLVEFEELLGARKDNTEAYREVLELRPWRACPCDVCQDLGHHVIMFRGAERNRRRGFHNTWVFYRRLQTGKALAPEKPKPKAHGRRGSNKQQEMSLTSQ